MRPHNAELLDVLTGSFDLSYQADLYYDGVRQFQDLPITSPSITWDAGGQVEGSGSATVVWTNAQATSLKPNEPQDWLAPFGSSLRIFAVVSAGASRHRIQLGELLIASVPRANDSPFIRGETRISVGSRVEVVLQDRMVQVQRDRFTQLQQPSQLASVYVELAALTGLQLTRTVADGPISRSVVYEDDRVAAVQDLAGILGAVAFMEWDDTLSLRTTEPGAPVAELTVGEDGTVAVVGAVLDADTVYNGVVIRGETDGQTAILAQRWVTEGPLRATPDGGARTPFHRKPRFYSSPFITSQAQAEAAIDGLLVQYSQPRAAELEVQCLINPLVQVGDVVTVFDGLADWTIRLKRVPLGESAYMTVTGSVIERVVRG